MNKNTQPKLGTYFIYCWYNSISRILNSINCNFECNFSEMTLGLAMCGKNEIISSFLFPTLFSVVHFGREDGGRERAYRMCVMCAGKRIFVSLEIRNRCAHDTTMMYIPELCEIIMNDGRRRGGRGGKK